MSLSCILVWLLLASKLVIVFCATAHTVSDTVYVGGYARGYGLRSNDTLFTLASFSDSSGWASIPPDPIAAAAQRFQQLGRINVILVNDTSLYIGGYFTWGDYGVTTLNSIALFDARTASFAPLGGGVNGEVYAIATVENSVIVGGSFTRAYNTFDEYVEVSNIAVWSNAAGWSALGSYQSDAVIGTVRAVAVGEQPGLGKVIYVAGERGETNRPKPFEENIPNNRDVFGRSDSGAFIGMTQYDYPSDWVDLTDGLISANARLYGLRVVRTCRTNRSVMSRDGPYGDNAMMEQNGTCVVGDTLYVVGQFDMIGGVNMTQCIARWDGQWAAVDGDVSTAAFGSGASQPVRMPAGALCPLYAIEVLRLAEPTTAEAQLYIAVGGMFDVSITLASNGTGPTPSPEIVFYNNIALWEPPQDSQKGPSNGTWYSLKGGVYATEGLGNEPAVWALGTTANLLYVGGNFEFAGVVQPEKREAYHSANKNYHNVQQSTATAVAVNSIAMFNLTSQQWTALASDSGFFPPSYVPQLTVVGTLALTESGNGLYVVFDEVMDNYPVATTMGYYSRPESEWFTIVNNSLTVDGAVYAITMATDDPTNHGLYVAGAFNFIGNQSSCMPVARYDPTVATWTPLGCGSDVDTAKFAGEITRLVVVGEKVFAAGNFTLHYTEVPSMNKSAITGFAVWTSADQSWGSPVPGGSDSSMVISAMQYAGDNKLFLSGVFLLNGTCGVQIANVSWYDVVRGEFYPVFGPGVVEMGGYGYYAYNYGYYDYDSEAREGHVSNVETLIEPPMQGVDQVPSVLTAVLDTKSQTLFVGGWFELFIPAGSNGFSGNYTFLNIAAMNVTSALTNTSSSMSTQAIFIPFPRIGLDPAGVHSSEFRVVSMVTVPSASPDTPPDLFISGVFPIVNVTYPNSTAEGGSEGIHQEVAANNIAWLHFDVDKRIYVPVNLSDGMPGSANVAGVAYSPATRRLYAVGSFVSAGRLLNNDFAVWHTDTQTWQIAPHQQDIMWHGSLYAIYVVPGSRVRQPATDGDSSTALVIGWLVAVVCIGGVAVAIGIGMTAFIFWRTLRQRSVKGRPYIPITTPTANGRSPSMTDGISQLSPIATIPATTPKSPTTPMVAANAAPLGRQGKRSFSMSLRQPSFDAATPYGSSLLSGGSVATPSVSTSTAAAPGFPTSFIIPYNQLNIVNPPIGQGAFGVVNRAYYHGTEVAVKTFLPLSMSTPMGDNAEDNAEQSEAFEQFSREVEALQHLRHPNIVLCIGVCLSPPCIVTEFVTRGSLMDVYGRTPSKLTWQRVLRLALQTARGMAYLHSQHPPVLHRDLKSGNVLVSKDWSAKICDFGISRPMSVTTAMTQHVGTSRWSAPEVLLGVANYGKKADVYGFAMVCYELVMKQLPFTEIKFDYQVERKVLAGERPTLATERVPSAAFVELVHECWAPDPETRPDFKEIIERLEVIASV